MKNARPKVKRPDYGLVNPSEQRGTNTSIYYLLIIISILLFLGYSVYVVDSFAEIILQTTSIARLLNIAIFMVEILLAYYSILLLVHLAKGFMKTSSPLANEYKLQNINNREDLPFVTVMLPMYEEPLSVVKQTIAASLDLNYPVDKYEVIVVDDSKSNAPLKEYCRSHEIEYITRDHRTGFKAGGINNALRFVKGEYILFLDADHIAERNVVKNCLLSWRQNTIAVQTRIDFVNMRTFLTTVAGFLQLQFFSLFQRARRPSGSAIFAGGGALFKTELLRKFNGFDPLTIADDTDNSFIFISEGYRIEYIDHVGAWALVPWDPLHLLRQIWRWLTGITRSFRARWLTIIRGKGSLYTKIDHFSVGFFPTLSILGWSVAFILLYAVANDIQLVRTKLISDYAYFGLIPAFVSSLAIITGTIAVFLDDKRILIHRKPLYYKIMVVAGFYLLILAAQPLLIGAIIKGLTGIKVSFNRTPKEKKSSDNLTTIMRQYVIYTSVIFLTGIIFLIYAFKLPLSDPRAIALLINSYAAIIPVVIALMWYWKLESYLDQVADITAIQVLEETIL